LKLADGDPENHLSAKMRDCEDFSSEYDCDIIELRSPYSAGSDETFISIIAAFVLNPVMISRDIESTN
jgi:hypothetical protein